MDKGRGTKSIQNPSPWKPDLIQRLVELVERRIKMIRTRAKGGRQGVQHCWDSHELKAVALQLLRNLELAKLRAAKIAQGSSLGSSAHSAGSGLSNILHPRLWNQSDTINGHHPHQSQSETHSKNVIDLQSFLLKTMTVHPVHDLKGAPGEMFVAQFKRASSDQEEFWGFIRILKGKWLIFEVSDRLDLLESLEKMSVAEIDHALSEVEQRNLGSKPFKDIA